MTEITFHDCEYRYEHENKINKDNKPIKTKFGNASIHSDGYYKINSKKEGNYMKHLHRLIFEDFYKIQLPNHIIIHHDDEDKTNNEIWNLIPMTRAEHCFIHSKGKVVSEKTKQVMSKVRKGKPVSEETKKRLRALNENRKHTDETKKKISEAIRGENHYMYGKKHSFEKRMKMGKTKTQTGVLYVYKSKNKSCDKGYIWRYKYSENGKIKSINSVTFKRLREKVLAKGLDWIVLDEKKAKECELL